jgi:hypothetical protein
MVGPRLWRHGSRLGGLGKRDRFELDGGSDQAMPVWEEVRMM